jgi:hypothetical protein
MPVMFWSLITSAAVLVLVGGVCAVRGRATDDGFGFTTPFRVLMASMALACWGAAAAGLLLAFCTRGR